MRIKSKVMISGRYVDFEFEGTLSEVEGLELATEIIKKSLIKIATN